MQPGPPLEREQVAGIQRLVAASVADLDPAHVVVTDQRGVTLSDPDTLTGPGGVGGGRLAMKREIEEYFTRKIADLLESAYGPGQVIVSVDVALNFDEIHRTVQSLLPASSSAPADVGVHRKRQVITGGAPPDEAANPGENDSNARRPVSSSTDVEYEYGRRVEQVVSSPGNIEQMSVGVVVRGQLSDEKQARIAQLVRMAAGLNERRGDAVTVQLLDATETRAARGAQPPEPAAAAIGAEPIPPPVKPTASVVPSLALLAGAAGLIAGLLLVLLGTRPRKSAPARPLTTAERADLLNELQQTFASPAPAERQS
jgi:flagellar M-ring protein FliF